MSKLHPEKFFNDFEPLETRLNKDSEIQYEKIKLEFSILNANVGIYRIQGKLFDNQLIDYISEIKRNNSRQKIIFDKFFICNFFFQKEQLLSLFVYKNKNKYEINTTIGAIIGSKNCIFIHKYTEVESLVIKAEKLDKEEDLLNVKFTLKNNKDENEFIKNKYYYQITCENNDIVESAQITNEGTFEPINIPINLLQPFYTVNLFTIQNKLIFSFNSSIDKIKSKQEIKITIPIKRDNYLTLYDNSEIIKNFTFIDYIKSGVKIALSIGIDFTGSNGHPKDFGSLHSIMGPNDYERAITSCAKIVGKYDDDQLFPVFGFGAIINSPGEKEASMCFNLNFSKDPNIYTINNIIKTYHDCIEQEKLTFSGPTKFTPLIKEVILRINKNDLYEYHILMILTDGVIDDMQETVDILVEASLLPLSVIIIGIGNADFSKMEILDGDETPLTSSMGEKRKRDLVQFVPFSKYQNNEEKLAMEVLAEIPRQIVEFYQFKNLNPEQIEYSLKKQKNINNFNINIDNPFYNNNINNNNINTNNNINLFSNNFRKEQKQYNKIVDNSSYFLTENSQDINTNRSKSKNNSNQNYNIINSNRRPISKIIPSIHINDSYEHKNKIPYKRSSTKDNLKNSLGDSTQRKLNQKNPFYIGANNNRNNNNIKINYNSRYNYLNLDNIDNTLDNKNKKSLNLINIGYNIINTNSNIFNNNHNNYNNNRFSFDETGFKNFIDLDKLSLHETINLKNNDLEKKGKNKKFK